MKIHQLITCNVCLKDFKTGSFYQHKTNRVSESIPVDEKPEMKCDKCDYVSKF